MASLCLSEGSGAKEEQPRRPRNSSPAPRAEQSVHCVSVCECASGAPSTAAGGAIHSFPPFGAGRGRVSGAQFGGLNFGNDKGLWGKGDDPAVSVDRAVICLTSNGASKARKKPSVLLDKETGAGERKVRGPTVSERAEQKVVTKDRAVARAQGCPRPAVGGGVSPKGVGVMTRPGGALQAPGTRR